MKKKTPTEAIRLKCLDCCNNSKNEVKLCPIVKCPLYSYRLGEKTVLKKVAKSKRNKVSSRK